MRKPHVLCDDPSGDALALPPDAERHLRKVLRLRDGAVLTVTDGRGGVVEARLRAGVAEVTGVWEKLPRPSTVALCPGVPKARKLDMVVEKATELGVAVIAPVLTERTERDWGDTAVEKRLRRWREIARSALEQSKGAWLPEVRAPVPIGEALSGRRGVMLDPSGGSVDWASESGDAVLVGPEGGFTPEEVDRARSAGWKVGALGPTLLRTETAAVVGAALAVNARAEWLRPDRYDQH